MLRWAAVLKTLCLCFLIVLALAGSTRAEKESVLIYIAGGPAFPVGDSNLDAGFSAGGGIGFVLTSDSEYSLELGIRFNWYRFRKESYLTRYFSQYDVGHEYHTTLNLELKFRKNLGRFFNPYGVFGLAYYGDWGYYSLSTLTLGVGSDLGTGPEKKRLLFWEIRYIPDPYAVIKLHVGIRLG